MSSKPRSWTTLEQCCRWPDLRWQPYLTEGFATPEWQAVLSARGFFGEYQTFMSQALMDGYFGSKLRFRKASSAITRRSELPGGLPTDIG
jgi:hypothetical protein